MKTWFITGASRGFGRIWAEAALTRQDKFAATARTLADLTDLADDAVRLMVLDMTDPDQTRHVLRQAQARFGRLDVVPNNAAYTLRPLQAGCQSACVGQEWEATPCRSISR